MKKTLNFHATEDISNFVVAMSKFNSDINAKCGRYVVDAKSILGVFSFGLPKSLEVEILSDDKAECEKFASVVSQWA